MKEKQLLKISLICSLLGIIILFFISEQIKVDETTLDRIDELEVGTSVSVEGIINKINEYEKIAYIELMQSQTTTVVLFKESNLTNLKQGDFVKVEGEIQEYEGEFQIVGNEIKIIN